MRGVSEHISSSLETQGLVPGLLLGKPNLHVAGLRLAREN